MASAWGWRRRWLTLLVILMVAVVGIWWLGNRSVSSPTLAERQARLNLAINWVLQQAAQIAHRDDLMAMVDRTVAKIESGGGPRSPWLRFVKPDAVVTIERVDFGALASYQQALLSALTCGAYDQLRELPEDWRHQNVCRPSLVQGFVDGGVCSTHQLMALMAVQRQRCQGMPWDASLIPSLQEDIFL
jgi:hypothetical protein